MPVLDFTEISQANTSDGDQDKFELFSREFLSLLGFKIQSDPGRGPDGGKDIIAVESRKGIVGETNIKRLVSCKHYAHSGRSVGTSDETNIRDRVESNKCDAFLGIYSTLPSSSLVTALESLGKRKETKWFDNEYIERMLLPTTEGHELAKRFFPVSFENWKSENPKPVSLFSDNKGLKCCYCNKELLNSDEITGIIVGWDKKVDEDKTRYFDLYWCCRGKCDDNLSKRHDQSKEHDAWEEISDIIIPQIYMKWIMVTINHLNSPKIEYSENYLDKLKTFLLEVYPYVARDLTTRERERLSLLGEFGLL